VKARGLEIVLLAISEVKPEECAWIGEA